MLIQTTRIMNYLALDKINRLENIKYILYAIFFSSSFIHRDTSNISLILLLIVCLLDYKHLLKTITERLFIFYSIILFTCWISISAVHNNVPINEMDNYFRLILLLPLLSVSLNYKQIRIVIFLASFLALAHFLFLADYKGIGRLQGSSSTVATYAFMCTTIILLSIYLSMNPSKKIKLFYYLVASLMLLLLFETESRAAFITLIII